MRVAWLEIHNFRSIKHLRVSGLDKPQIIIEGPNDVGKSNILHALDLAFRTLPSLLRKKAGQGDDLTPGEPSPNPYWLNDLDSLYHAGTQGFAISLSIRFDTADAPTDLRLEEGTVTLHLAWTRGLGPQLAEVSPVQRAEALLYLSRALSPVFRLVTTNRNPQREYFQPRGDLPWVQQARWKGQNLKEMLFLYKNSPELEVQERFEQLRGSAKDPELGIGLMNVSIQPNQTISVRTRNHGLELDLEDRGSGIQQLLTLLSLAICHTGRILAIEEPEMNLSESNQRLLWKKLREFSSNTGPLDQIFLTSHSRIFEEEAERLIVSRDLEAGTQARWAEPTPKQHHPDEEVLPVARGGGITLSDDIRAHLGIQEGQHLYLVPTKGGYQLMGPAGYAEHLREEDADASPAE